MKKVIFLLLMAMSFKVSAEPTILYDTGSTTSIQHYLDALNMTDEPVSPMPLPAYEDVSTPEMTLGKVKAVAVKLPMLNNPLFLIGTDKQSQAWLSRNKQTLIRIGAVGMIVNSTSEQSTMDTLKLATGLTVSTASASSLAVRFKLNHYPVLITKTGISQ